MLETVQDHHLDVILALGDGIIAQVTSDEIVPYVDANFPKDKVDEYLQTVGKFSAIPNVKQFLKDKINETPITSIRTFILLSVALDSRIIAPILTNSLTPIREMSDKQKKDLINSWAFSPLGAKQRLFRVIYTLTILAFLSNAPSIHYEIVGSYGKEVRESLAEAQGINDYVYQMMSTPNADKSVLNLDIDALIVGSGAGAGVVAHTLSSQGFKCVVVEKGKYYKKDDLTLGEKDGFKALYEGGGVLTKDQSLTVLSGSVFGGGTTVNWSASLKTPFKVREEWHKEFGLNWAATEDFDECQQYVFDKIGASTKNLKHSFTNRVILEGSKKLGYPVKEVPQNNGGYENHDCGFCYLGCKFGVKQGSVDCWFQHSPGCQFMTEVRVLKLLHEKGKAYAAVCQKSDGTQFIIKGPKKFVMCAGSLCTPIVLQHSGFKNKNIGANLKLHPVSVLFGDFGVENRSDPEHAAILTTVNGKTADLDGNGYGSRIESILHSQTLESSFLPWRGTDVLRKRWLNYRQLSAILLITRDKSSGYVSATEDRPDALVVDYSVNKFDRNALHQSMLVAADILYIEGAKEIIPSANNIPEFKSDKPKSQRSINDPEYTRWRQKVAKLELKAYDGLFGSAHQMSSCRMASTPRHGACDTKGKLFESTNVYVADGSALPTASGVNPMVTILTFGRYVGLQIAEDLKPQAKM